MTKASALGIDLITRSPLSDPFRVTNEMWSKLIFLNICQEQLVLQ